MLDLDTTALHRRFDRLVASPALRDSRDGLHPTAVVGLFEDSIAILRINKHRAPASSRSGNTCGLISPIPRG